MAFRPAGMSDSDEDDDDDFTYGYSRRVCRFTNGGPGSMCEAIRASDIKALEKCISSTLSRGLLLNYEDTTKDWPLLLASSNRWVEGIELLLKNGADPNVQRELVTPLAVCCTSIGIGESALEGDCVQLLLKYGADVNVKNQLGQVPLIIAAVHNSITVVEQLLQFRDIDINVTDPLGRTALFYAYINGNTTMVDLLVSAGINTNKKDVYSNLASEMTPKLSDDKIFENVKVSQLFENSIPEASCVIGELTDEIDRQKLASFLNILPDDNGNGGFSDLVQSILEFSDLPNLTLSNAQLPDLLSGDEATLVKLGVKLSYHRDRILKAAHRFHCFRWKPSSILDIKFDSVLSTESMGENLCNILLHLVLMQSSLLYLQSRINKSVDNTECSDVRKDTIIVLVELHTAQKLIKNKLQSVLNHINKMKSLQDKPVDFIGTSMNLKRRSSTFIIASTALSILGVSYLYFLAKKLFI